jgi:dipeptidase D
MQNDISRLEPSAIWRNFAKLNRVPRPSKKEERVIQFMLAYGRSLGLETFKDKVGNVIIRKPPSMGMADCKPVILQAHLDMVHQKNADTVFDFDREGIAMYADGGWVRAHGTTLGADNGMGVAAIMAVLADDSLSHPPLEALFTVDEETGMTGAKGLEPGVLRGQILLNLDTEEDDEIDIGCAGGVDITAGGFYEEVPPDTKACSYTIRVKGLQGGHSGMDIHRGLGNANKIMNSILYMAGTKHGLSVGEIDGGGLRNAIPRESVARVTVPAGQKEAFEKNFHAWAGGIRKELEATEPSLVLQLMADSLPESVMHEKAQLKMLIAIAEAHNGVYSMSNKMEGLVEASNNIARVSVGQGIITIGCLARSSEDVVKAEMAAELRSVLEIAGLEVTFSGEYPGWNPDPDSEILGIMRSRYRLLFNEEPRVVACHAGLECGILGAIYPNMEMISFGPTIRGAHSPDEGVKISSVGKFWTLLLDILAHIPRK